MVAIALTFLALATSALAVINTPTGLVTCQPSALTWTASTAPYYVSVLPGGQASAAALVSFPANNELSTTWTVNLPAGTSITLQLRDGTGALSYSDVASIQAGTDTSCVGTSASAAAGTAAATSAPAAAGTSRAAAATSAAGSAAGSVAGAASSAAASAKPSTTPTGSASRNAAGVVGAAVVAAVAFAL